MEGLWLYLHAAALLALVAMMGAVVWLLNEIRKAVRR